MFARALLTICAATLMGACAAEPAPAAETMPAAAPAAAPAPAMPDDAGWQVRIDESTSATDPDDTRDITFEPMGATGFHYVGGPAGTLWIPGTEATGAYTLSATFTQNVPASHTTFYGLVFGGSNIGEADQRYLYFQVAQNGTFLIKERTGDATVDLEGGETAHEAVVVPEGGSAVNALAVRVAADAIDFVVNDTVVHTVGRDGTFGQTDGDIGARVNHVLDVTVTNLRVE
jgi:hypothetical protein